MTVSGCFSGQSITFRCQYIISRVQNKSQILNLGCHIGCDLGVTSTWRSHPAQSLCLSAF